MTKEKKDKRVPDQEALAEVFPNNPLKQVAFEVRFQRNLKVLRDIGDMQVQLGPAFSFTGREEIPFPKEPPAQSYGFSHSNGNLTVKAGEDRFAVLVTKYENFEMFVEEVMKWTQRFCELFHIKNFKRVGLRYVNNIVVPYDENGFSLEQYINPYVELSRLEPAKLNQFSVELLTEKPECKFNTRSAFVATPNPILPEGSYILDLDAFVEKVTSIEALNTILNLLHNEAQIEFLTHVTDKYKTIMRRGK